MYWIRSCPATGRQECDGTFAPTPHSLPDIYEYLEERRVFYAIAEQQSAAIRDRSTADTTCGEAAEASSDPIRRLLVSCRELGPRSKVEWHRGELFPRVGFIVTNMTASFLQWTRDSRAVSKRGSTR